MRNIKSTIPAIILSDVCALLLAFGLAYVFRSGLDDFRIWRSYLHLVPIIALFVPLYAALGLYPGLLLTGPEHLKRLSIATSIGVLFLSGVLFAGRLSLDYSRMVVFLFWLLALFLVPLCRFLSRKIYARCHWWGYPVVLIGRGSLTALLARHLRSLPELGYRAVAVFDLDGEGQNMAGLESVRLSEQNAEAGGQLKSISDQHPGAMAVLIMEGLDRERQEKIFQLANRHFRRLLLMPDKSLPLRLSVRLSMFCSRMSLSLRQNLLDPYRRQWKRTLDLMIMAFILLPCIPLFLLIALAIKLDSSGPAFYRQDRIGLGGRGIKIWKFRTMYAEAERMLDNYLAENPRLREEWEREQKLKNDPRITRVGKLLRKASLDELPQLFNVLNGTMSLVGPRPIVKGEIKKYGRAFALYIQVRPGISGLWQISGRSNVSYATRVALDETYIANWSVWLDIYIMVRTIPAALTTNGAY
ncbi:MAG: undecaprenyl-phosphate galactose phosphotransferase WbaP [Deltaproteobacteria bacterium]|jgi:Undecaprenyl-phosphate galactose phosphotransferase WbaP|nr:undecaprenyl-phosphate galactose phosphotransferase WbaP [Deltaproteobacteria bacterium]